MCVQRSCCVSSEQADRFVRNTVYRGSLTQRTPVAKSKTRSTAAVQLLSVATVKSSTLTKHRRSFGKEKLEGVKLANFMTAKFHLKVIQG